MNSLEQILENINKLSQTDLDRLLSLLADKNTKTETFDRFVENNRFKKGIVCPHCKSTSTVRNGLNKLTQRYICKGCRKSFTVRTNTITASSKKSLAVWKKYLKCLMDGFSVRKSALECGINKDTSFIWRHKILDALQNMANNVTLNGIIEGDETFFSISYKGNHKNSTFKMPRKSHIRGNETHIRGLSHEKVCVPCAVNKTGFSIAKISNLGRVSTKDLHFVFDNRIEKESILCTDVMNSYREFAKKNGLELIQLKDGKSRKGVYHIQHINSYHSMLKNFMIRFHGVSTKYLNNYLIWNNFVNYARESYTEKQSILEEFVLSTDKKDLSKNVPIRNALPIRLAA